MSIATDSSHGPQVSPIAFNVKSICDNRPRAKRSHNVLSCSFDLVVPIRCRVGTICHNTNGSYECACPAGMMAIPANGLPSGCIGEQSTSPCCKDSEVCKASFTCASSVSQMCAPHATCIADPSGTTFGCKCVCDKGYIGSGYRCEEKQPQPTPVIDKDGNLQGHLPASAYCGCHVPRVDFCIGVALKEHQLCESNSKGYRLRCETGYVEVSW